jgi:hypothetical protein
VNAAEAISISLEGMRDAAKWPARLRDPRLDPERQDFDRLVAQARAQIQKDEEIDPETLDQIRGVAKRILDKLTEQPLTSQAEDQAAMNFAKTVVALTRMLEKPNVEPVLNELRKIEKTDVSHLLGFMRTFNLRFGPATTPAQRNAYMQLYPSMDDARDKLLAELKLPDAPPSYKAKPEEFFSAMSDEQLQGKKPQAPPAPPAPQP